RGGPPRTRPRRRPGGGARAVARPPGGRALDGRRRRHARVGRPRRLALDRPRHAPRVGAARPRARGRRGMEPVALLRSDPGVAARARVAAPQSQGELLMWTVTPSPVGDLRVVERDGALTAIEFAPFPRV